MFCFKRICLIFAANPFFMSETLLIRAADPADYEATWDILRQTNLAGDTFAYPEDWDREKMLAYWFGPDRYTYTALWNGIVVGSFYIKENQPGRGSHIANAGYTTSTQHRGKGIAYAMGAWSLEEARRLGFLAIQFNLVVSTNEVAVRLWQRLGFRIIGEVPEAFQHARLGLVSAYVMYQKLSDLSGAGSEK
jgi:GNAT superfamily N-acetyltransferase